MLFVSSIDLDFNAKQEEIRFDDKGYFMIDVRSKPARPLALALLSRQDGAYPARQKLPTYHWAPPE